MLQMNYIVQSDWLAKRYNLFSSRTDRTCDLFNWRFLFSKNNKKHYWPSFFGANIEILSTRRSFLCSRIDHDLRTEANNTGPRAGPIATTVFTNSNSYTTNTYTFSSTLLDTRERARTGREAPSDSLRSRRRFIYSAKLGGLAREGNARRKGRGSHLSLSRLPLSRASSKFSPTNEPPPATQATFEARSQ